jgi:transcriptional regulator with XRE-family HTH domain
MSTGKEGAQFGALVQQHRRLGGLTQEELAAQTELSVRAIRNLELGLVRRPRRDTVQRLVRALRLDQEAADQLRSAVRPAVVLLPSPRRTGSGTAEPPMIPAALEDTLARLMDRFDGRVLVVPVVLVGNAAAEPPA